MKLLLTMAILFCSNTFAHENEHTIKGSIYADDYKGTIAKLRSLEIDIAGVDYKNKIIDVLLNDYKHKLLSQSGIDAKVTWSKSVSFEPQVDPEYKDAYEVERFIQTAEGLFPELTKVFEIGKSVEGRSIWAIKISDNAADREVGEPTILFNSMHHAREIMTPEVSMDIIEYLLSNYGNDSKVTSWVDNNEIWVVPMLNVDGNAKVWEGQNMWRKNARGGYGVDLNRNYPHTWNSCNGSSGNQNADDYRGPEPASEPETRALMGLVEKIKPVFDISYHAYSELVLYPFGCRNGRFAAVNESMKSIGAQMGRELGYRAGTPWELLYEADGSDIDWMLGVHQVIPYVLEINSRADGFQPRYSTTRDRTVELNRKGWQILLDRLDGPGVRGYKPELANKNIKVFKAGKEIQTYRVNPDGTFHIVLEPGNYSLQAEGLPGLMNQVKISDKRVDIK